MFAGLFTVILIGLLVENVNMVKKHQKPNPQRGIQGVDGAVAFGGGVQDFALHADFDHRFRKDAAPLTVFDVDKEINQLEGRFVAVLLPLQHDGDGGFRCFKGKTSGFELLDLIEDWNYLSPFDFNAMFFCFAEQVAAPR